MFISFSEVGEAIVDKVDPQVEDENIITNAAIDPNDLLRNLMERRTNFQGWQTYEVPWARISLPNLQWLYESADNPMLRTIIVSIIIDDMRTYSKKFGREVYKNIARQLVLKFSRTFQDRDDKGDILGDGISSIANKLESRATYLERPHVRKSNTLDDKLNIPAKLFKLGRSVTASTTDWQPKENPINETAESLDQKRCKLNTLFLNVPLSDRDTKIANQLLEATFVTQRTFFNKLTKIPNITEIREKWT